MGPAGGVRLETVWEGTKLITMKVLGGGRQMRLSFPYSSIELQHWASQAEMEGHLAAFDGKLVIGESAEQEREFFSATIQPEFREAKARRLAAGVCSEGHGSAPQILPLPNHGLLLFGLDSEIVAIRADAGGIAYGGVAGCPVDSETGEEKPCL